MTISPRSSGVVQVAILGKSANLERIRLSGRTIAAWKKAGR